MVSWVDFVHVFACCWIVCDNMHGNTLKSCGSANEYKPLCWVPKVADKHARHVCLMFVRTVWLGRSVAGSVGQSVGLVSRCHHPWGRDDGVVIVWGVRWFGRLVFVDCGPVTQCVHIARCCGFVLFSWERAATNSCVACFWRVRQRRSFWVGFHVEIYVSLCICQLLCLMGMAEMPNDNGQSVLWCKWFLAGVYWYVFVNDNNNVIWPCRLIVLRVDYEIHNNLLMNPVQQNDSSAMEKWQTRATEWVFDLRFWRLRTMTSRSKLKELWRFSYNNGSCSASFGSFSCRKLRTVIQYWCTFWRGDVEKIKVILRRVIE